MEEIIADLQSRLAFQEATIDALNHAAARQDQLIKLLLRDVAELQGQVRELSPGSFTETGGELPPPHY